MSLDLGVGLVLSIAAAAYVTFAMLRPERF